jgi:hypothetical protein
MTMATIKMCTDIPQSKKLAEILSIESADMYYMNGTKHVMVIPNYETDFFNLQEKDIPCWSLASLLSVLPLHLIVNNQRYAFSMIKGFDKNGETYAIKYAIFNTTFYFHLTDAYDNPVDACYEMILKLNELKML